jgi:spore germination cell wall hydrolase CwlJ-like protein
MLWRRRLTWFWLHDARESLPFLAMIGLPFLAIAGFIYLACVEEPHVELDRTALVQREIERAHRRENDLQCLAENIYFEARGEPLDGQYAVAEVTLNRTQAPYFPHTICAVVHERRWDPTRRRFIADFSWTELGALSPDDGAAWKRAMDVASSAYDDMHEPVVPGALFYHATSVRPSWAKSRKTVATIGNHVFYR